jgi:hypothetical protein
MIHIKYHENKVNSLRNKEGIKTRESKIKHLQKKLLELRQFIKSNVYKISKNLFLSASIDCVRNYGFHNKRGDQ